MILGLVFCGCAVSHVKINHSPQPGGVVVPYSVAVTAAGNKEFVPIFFENITTPCIARNNHRGSTLPLYFGRVGYTLDFCVAGAREGVSFSDFATEVTLTDDAIEFASARGLGSTKMVGSATTNSILLAGLKFETGGTPNLQFEITATSVVTRATQPQISAGEYGPFDLLGAEVHTDPTAPDPVIAIAPGAKHRFWLQYDGMRYSLWREENDNNISDLVSMALLIIGAVVFIPNSVALTEHVRTKNYSGAVTMIAGDDSILHIVLVDFASTAACIIFFQVFSHGIGQGAFRTKQVKETSEWLDVVMVVSTVIMLFAVGWCVLVCRVAFEEAIKKATMATRVHRRLVRAVRFVGCGSSTTFGVADVRHAVVGRAAYEYIVVVAFMAACPVGLGHGFIQCIYLLSACVMAVVLGRDFGIVYTLCRKTGSHSIAATVAGMIFIVVSTIPLVGYCIYPIIEDSRSFPTTGDITTSIAFTSYMVLFTIGIQAGVLVVQ